MTDTSNKHEKRQMPAQRRLAISRLFAERPAVRIEELAEEFDVSRETIRRDLINLEERGEIQRVHGGGIRREMSSSEPPFEVRLVQQAREKTAMARIAADLVTDAKTVFLDVGTSVARVVDFLPDVFTGEVITNSVLAAQALAARNDIEVILCGGRMRHGDLALSGPVAAGMLRDIFVEVALLGSGGVDPQHGLTDFYPDEIDLRRVVIENTQTRYVLADSTKIGRVATHRVVALDRLDGIITDDGVEPEFVQEFRNLGIEVRVASTTDD